MCKISFSGTTRLFSSSIFQILLQIYQPVFSQFTSLSVTKNSSGLTDIDRVNSQYLFIVQRSIWVGTYYTSKNTPWNVNTLGVYVGQS